MVASDTATNAAYGLADCCTGNQAAFESYYSDYWFQQLTKTPAQRGETGGVQLRYVRFFAPYDILGTYNAATGRCEYSWDFVSDGNTDVSGSTAGGSNSAWYPFVYKLLDAVHDGLTPLVAFRQSTTDGQRGGTITSGPYAGVYPAEAAAPDPTQLVQEEDYECGVDYLMYWTVQDSVPVANWEAWNEPDGLTLYNQPSGTNYGTGTWRAAYLWYTLNYYGAAFSRLSGYPSENAAALTLSHANHTGYLDSYVTNVAGIAHCTVGFQPTWGCNGTNGNGWPTTTPTYWAVHDYDDATIGGQADLKAFATDLAGKSLSPAPQIWVTEAGIRLDSPTTADDNVTSVACDNGEADDRNTFGCDVDGSGSAYQLLQYDNAEDWISLGAISEGSVKTTMVLWYMYQLQNFAFPWDSALTDAAGSGRASYCALYGIPLGGMYTSCTGNSTDYETASK